MGSSATYAYDNWDDLERERKKSLREEGTLKYQRALGRADRVKLQLATLLNSMPENEWHKIKSIKVDL